ncbi:MAG: deoxyguanosinetriphosphate triphosphohydrolase [Gammaproteobacteria bacterium]|nr:deoxyguanosinetriphosphate triphosphohydrolase [Gammaproteobacteria bacterium]
MQTLADYASLGSESRGRRHEEPSPSYRDEFQRDRDRIIHSGSFRRLEYKTQVFVNHEGDLFRTRLTHSIEVAQIARSIARALRLNEDLTEAIALAHDLGHTPFGHAGQDALNHCMKEYGGFEHNLQSLRVVDKLEEHYAEFQGLNLTFESREGILKHCSMDHARALGEIGERFINKTQPSLEAQLTNLADEIGYNNHDVDDGLRSGLITIDDLAEVEIFQQQYEIVRAKYPQLNLRRTIHEIVRRMINCLVVDLIETSIQNLAEAQPVDSQAVRQQTQALISFSPAMKQQSLQLKQFLRKNLYRHYRVLRMSSKATRVLRKLFDAFMDEPELLPVDAWQQTQKLQQLSGTPGMARAIADYIAGMTDRYAITEYERIYNPRELT